MSEPKRYGFPMCECDATDELHMEEMGMAELKDGGFVKWEDYSKLIEDCKKWRQININLIMSQAELGNEIINLKAELSNSEREYKSLNSETKGYFDELQELKQKLKRLISAGDNLVGEGETMAHDVSWYPSLWHNLVIDWQSVKESNK